MRPKPCRSGCKNDGYTLPLGRYFHCFLIERGPRPREYGDGTEPGLSRLFSRPSELHHALASKPTIADTQDAARLPSRLSFDQPRRAHARPRAPASAATFAVRVENWRRTGWGSSTRSTASRKLTAVRRLHLISFPLSACCRSNRSRPRKYPAIAGGVSRGHRLKRAVTRRRPHRNNFARCCYCFVTGPAAEPEVIIRAGLEAIGGANLLAAAG
jgi:hypothetical protein